MVDVEFIKKKHEIDGWSIRRIAAQLEISRQTVRKGLASPAEPPRYEQHVPRPRPVVGPYLPIIERWLEEDEIALLRDVRIAEEQEARGETMAHDEVVARLRSRLAK